MVRRIALLLMAVSVSVALRPAVVAGAEIYRWTDADGRTHFSQDLGKVPPQHRAAARAAAAQPRADRVQRYSSGGPKPASLAPGPRRTRLPPGGKLRIPFESHHNLMYVQVRLNDRITAPFIVDTGASVVTLSRSFAEKLGLKVGKPNLKLHVVGGIREATWVVLDSVKLGGAEATRVDAVVVDKVGPDTDALVGLSFLSRFKLVLDPDKGALELKPRQ